MVGDGMVTFGMRLVTDLQELEIGELDRPRVAQLPGDVHHRRGEVDLAAGAVEARRDAAARLDALELLQKVDVEIGAPELAVGDALQPEILLEPDDVADRRVLDGTQLVLGDRSLLERSRASSSSLGRRKLPTWSARNGGLVPRVMGRFLESGRHLD